MTYTLQKQLPVEGQFIDNDWVLRVADIGTKRQCNYSLIYPFSSNRETAPLWNKDINFVMVSFGVRIELQINPFSASSCKISGLKSALDL